MFVHLCAQMYEHSFLLVPRSSVLGHVRVNARLLACLDMAQVSTRVRDWVRMGCCAADEAQMDVLDLPSQLWARGLRTKWNYLIGRRGWWCWRAVWDPWS